MMERINYTRCCGFGMFIPDPNVFHPGSRIQDPGVRIFPIPDPGSASKNLSILTQKTVSLGNMIRVVHRGPGSLFFTHHGSRIQGSKRHRILDPKSASLITRPCNKCYWCAGGAEEPGCGAWNPHQLWLAPSSGREPFPLLLLSPNL
jgi:hypothetical protein